MEPSLEKLPEAPKEPLLPKADEASEETKAAMLPKTPETLNVKLDESTEKPAIEYQTPAGKETAEPSQTTGAETPEVSDTPEVPEGEDKPKSFLDTVKGWFAKEEEPK